MICKTRDIVAISEIGKSTILDRIRGRRFVWAIRQSAWIDKTQVIMRLPDLSMLLTSRKIRRSVLQELVGERTCSIEQRTLEPSGRVPGRV